jgi:hypothetical protein
MATERVIIMSVDESISNEQLHELLCTGIYEDDTDSLAILAANVENFGMPVNKE